MQSIEEQPYVQVRAEYRAEEPLAASPFIVNQDGTVFQKNLGPNTTRIAAAFTQYDPDGSWQVSQP